MKKHKRAFEDYEELALDITTAMELLLWMTHIYNRAVFSGKILKLYRKLAQIKYELEEEMFLDYPERANGDVFHGEGNYELDIKKHRNYTYSAFKGKEK